MALPQGGIIRLAHATCPLRTAADVDALFGASSARTRDKVKEVLATGR